MHIPARYYKRIPKFYFIVGILLVISSFNMEENPLASYLYFIAGMVSVIYAVSVHQVRRKQRKARPPDDLRPMPVDDAPAAEKRQEFINDNAPPGDERQAPDRQSEAALHGAPSQAGVENRELAQHGGGVAAPAQPEQKP